MSSSEINDPTLNEAADLLQQQLIYNGEVLDIAFESLRSYKAGTQSLAYLDSSVYLAYALLRMLERWGKAKSGEMYVRKKKPKKKKNTKGSLTYLIPLLVTYARLTKESARKMVYPMSKKRLKSERKLYTRPCSPLRLLRW